MAAMKWKFTDGERIADRYFPEATMIDTVLRDDLSRHIDRLIRSRQAEAWDAGYEACRDGEPRGCNANPYRGKR